MASDFTLTVKEQADIVKIIGDYVRLKKAGAQNYTGLCPFHKEKTPSFSVHAGRQFFNCFGCHEHGDVFTFVQKIENVGFSESVRTVASAKARFCFAGRGGRTSPAREAARSA
jgi:DNA primase